MRFPLRPDVRGVLWRVSLAEEARGYLPGGVWQEYSAMGVVICSTTMFSGLMNGFVRNAVMAASRAAVGAEVVVVEGGALAPTA